MCDLPEENRVMEVEIKVRLDGNEVDGAKDRLTSLGAELKESVEEKDIYFTAPQRDFVETNECLRVRKREDYTEMTYKGESTDLMSEEDQFWKREVDMMIGSSPEEAEILLKSLDFEKLCEVEKKREKFELGEQTVTIDKVKDIGWFLEVESRVKNKAERKKALEENREVLRKLGLEDNEVVEEPYRDLVLGKKSTKKK